MAKAGYRDKGVNDTAPPYTIRSIGSDENSVIEGIARRMIDTLVEVLGPQRGTGMYALSETTQPSRPCAATPESYRTP